jgi:multidrug resistance efflux pump
MDIEKFSFDDVPLSPVTRSAGSIALGSVLLAVAVALVFATYARMKDTVDGFGTLEPRAVHLLRATAGGRVVHVNVKQGQYVQKGEILVELDSIAYAANEAKLRSEQRELRLALARDSANAELNRADRIQRVSQARSRLEASRTRTRERVVDYSASSNIDSVLRHYLRGSSIALDVALEEEAQLRSQLRMAEIELSRTSLAALDIERQRERIATAERQLADQIDQAKGTALAAPASGTVVTANPQALEGGYIDAGATVLEIIDESAWCVEVILRDLDVHRLRRGQKAIVTLPALGDAASSDYEALVDEIGEQAISSDVGQTVGRAYRVMLIVADTNGSLQRAEPRRGYGARVTIIVGEQSVLQFLLRRIKREPSSLRS